MNTPAQVAKNQGALAPYCANPLISPLASFHGRVVRTFDPLPPQGKTWTVLERIAVAAISAFAYLILGIVALAGLAVNTKYKTVPLRAPAENAVPASRPALPSLRLPAEPAPIEGLPRTTSAEPIESGKEGVPNAPVVEVLTVKEAPKETVKQKMIQVGKKLVPARILTRAQTVQLLQGAPVPNANRVAVT